MEMRAQCGMEPGPDTFSSKALTEPVRILKNSKVSTLMKMESFILETSISAIF